MKTSEAIAKAFQVEGTEVVFGLMGDANMDWMSDMESSGSRIVAVRNEAAAIAAAAGYSFTTGNVGVCSVTCGPGVTQTITPLIGAVRRGVPMVLVAGDVSIRYGQQYMDQRRLLEDCGATWLEVSSSGSALDVVYEAFYTARSKRTVVVLDVGYDVFTTEYPWDWEYKAVPPKLVELQRVGADPAVLAEIVASVSEAKMPIILAGTGAIHSGAAPALAALASRIGAILTTTLPAKGLFDGDPYSVGIAGAYASQFAEELFAEADLVLAFGASMNYYTTEGGLTFPSAKVICVDLALAPLRRFNTPDISVVADAKRFAEDLLVGLNSQPNQGQNTGFRSTEKYSPPERPTSNDNVPTNGLDPRDVVRGLDEQIHEKTMVVLGAGHFQDFVIQYLRHPGGGNFVFSIYFGSIGEGLATAIGVAVAKPDHRVLVFEGDGSLMTNIQELDTVARYNLNLGVVVMNDEGFGAERHKVRAGSAARNEDSPRGLKSFEIPSPDLRAVAAGFGLASEMVSEKSELAKALVNIATGEGPALLDLRVSPDVISEPFQKLYFGKENTAPHQGVVNPK